MTELEPKNQFVLFGEGSAVQYVSKKTETDFDGKTVWTFLLRPSKEVIFKYRLNTMTDLDPATNLILRRYPESVIHILDEDPNHTRILIHTDLNNRPTKYSKIFDKYVTQIDLLEQINNSKNATIARLLQELKIMASSIGEHTKLNVDLINIAREASKQLKRDEDDTSVDDYEE